MQTILTLKNSLYEKQAIRSGWERRQLLIEEMATLTDQKIHCFNCKGTCCTFSSNSMQITPLEAFEIILSLDMDMDMDMDQENWNELKIKLQKNIQDYRLNHEIFLGKKINPHLRKTYTCPFFVAGSKGCTIKKDLKPYGCLGFNPHIENDNGGQCHSNTKLLEIRENAEVQNENIANAYLKQELQLDWVKLEIPKAVLALIEIFF